MSSIQKILLVEDNPGDARLLSEMFSEAGTYDLEVTRVESMHEAETFLAAGVADLILVDLGLSDAQGLEAVRRARAAAPAIPLVVLTGLDDEALAVRALHEGAEDYLVKGQLEARGLQRALRHAIERKLLKEALSVEKAEAKVASNLFKALVENLPDVVARFDPDLRHTYVSPAIERLTGQPVGEFLGKTNRQLGLPPDLIELWETALRRVFGTGVSEWIEFSFEAVEGKRHFDCRMVPEAAPDGVIASVLSVARDVTDRWLAHEADRRSREVADQLREATVELTRSLDREAVLVTLLDRLRQLVPFDSATVMLVESASRLSVRAVFDGERVLPLAVEERPQVDAAEHPIVQRVLDSGAAVLIPDLRAHPDWNLPTDPPTAKSWMGVPLFARGNVAGLVALAKVEADYFSEEHVRLAEAMSSQASVAVENAVLFEQMQASTARLQALSHRLVEAQESERRNIARELHDEAGQSLASLRIGLRLLERELAQNENVTARVAELVETTDAVIEGLHRLAADLRPASLDHLGLDAALLQFTRSAASKFGLRVHFKARGFTSERLPSVVETALFRVVQEAMTNVVRHARATRVDVLVEVVDGRVRLMVEDDGAGFDPEVVQQGDHFGLLGLRERAEALGGTLTIESAPGSGTTVVVEVASADPHPDR